MNNENQISYYAIIPATVRYDKRLKAAEKLIYGEITALSNKHGYCFANNRYFANIYNVTIHTVSQWISHLEKLGYVCIELIRNEQKEIKERRIYINDNPYILKNTYPYLLKSTYPIYENVQDNTIKYNIDELFVFIMNRNSNISKEFYEILENLEFIYTEDILSIMLDEKVDMLKQIVYVLYSIYNSEYKYILSHMVRQDLINLYITTKEYKTDNFLNYYRRSIINKYALTEKNKEKNNVRIYK